MKDIVGLAGFFAGLRQAQGLERSVEVQGCREVFKTLALLALHHQGVEKKRGVFRDSQVKSRQILLLVPRLKDGERWLQQLQSSGITRAALLPGFSFWGSDYFSNYRGVQAQRLFALNQLLHPSQAGVVVATPAGLLQGTLAPESLRSEELSLVCGEEFPFDQLLAAFVQRGYREALMVEEPGSFTLHGGTIDIFPPAAPHPYRLEFYGDRLQGIRAFSLKDQRSVASYQQLVVSPAVELQVSAADKAQLTQLLFEELLRQELSVADRKAVMSAFAAGLHFPGFDGLAPLWRSQRSSALDYLSADTLLFLPQGLKPCLDELEQFLAEAQQSYREDREQGRLALSPERHFGGGKAELLAGLSALWQISFDEAPLLPHVSLRIKTLAAPQQLNPRAAREDFSSWLEEFKKWGDQEQQVVIFAKNETRLSLLQQHCREHGIHSTWLADPFALLLAPRQTSSLRGLGLSCGYLSEGYWDEAASVWFIPCEKIYGAEKQQRSASSAKRLQAVLLNHQQLSPGDLVVHRDHGIGRYMAVEQLRLGGDTGDFVKIEYQKGDKIYLPVANIALLAKYQQDGEGSSRASLDLLRGSSWQNRTRKVKKAVKDIAEALLTMQAKRQFYKGVAFASESELYRQFCEDFPYSPTPDQLRAFSEVDQDLASSKVMDRMVIGDVGFGKTEVALRAAFKVISEGYQVLFLVPTTILCYQHFATLNKRFAKYGLIASFVNRYISATEAKKRIQLFAAGKIDIIVGTHRLLSKDIAVKKLGLIIIDEEQKFGVEHKEKLKSLRLQADMLQLTATPIPRTLHMALLGLRDISLITTAPAKRLAVKTLVCSASEGLLGRIIRAELARDGQIFFVHNRVEDIEEICAYLQNIVPEAGIGCAHGQMREGQLEKVMLAFYEQKTSILVCTSIIESGIDMPNVNTLIVNNADHFGLAQLYQLRGRVGRGDVQGYAYFLAKNEARLNPEAKKRLEVVQNNQDLGAGFQIAHYDLEIRGTGNLLGAEQSGHVAAVGADYYQRELTQTLARLSGNELREEVDCEIKIPLSAFIPQSYMPREADRLKAYRQLFTAENQGEIEEVFSAIADQYGKPPEEVYRLVQVACLKKTLLAISAAKLLQVNSGHYQLIFRPLAEKAIAHLLRQVGEHQDLFALGSGFSLTIVLPEDGASSGSVQLLTSLQRALELLRC